MGANWSLKLTDEMMCKLQLGTVLDSDVGGFLDGYASMQSNKISK
jgi:hypothetical protein